MTVTVAVAQLRLQVGDVAANRAAGLDAVSAAAAAGAAVVVLPELSDTGYVLADRAEALSLADTGATLAAWAEAAAATGLVVVGGLCEAAGHTLYNSAAIVDPGGLRALYRKVHLWGREPEVFAAGSDAPPVVDTPAGRLGLVVCYDLEFPEWVRMAAAAGAELVVAPVNWPLAPRPAGERPVEVVTAQAVAGLNRVAMAVADRCGRERGVDWVGGSLILDADGYPLAGPLLADRPDLLLAEVDLVASRDKRIGEHNDRVADRRPELYR